MKTIDDVCKSDHNIVKSFGYSVKGDLSVKGHVGECYYCHESVVITKKYRHVSNGIYELKKTNKKL